MGAYTCAGRGTCNLQLATCNLCVYAAAVRVFLGIGRGIRRWVRIRASVTGAYLEPTQGWVSFVQESLLVGLVRIEYGARGGRPTRGPRPQRPTTPCTTHRRTRTARTPRDLGCRADVTQRGRGRRDVRTAQSPLATASNRHPRVALPVRHRPFVPAARCLDALTAHQHSRTKATVLTAITRGAPHGVLYGGRPRPRGSCRKRPGASAACSRTSSVESISSRWSR